MKSYLRLGRKEHDSAFVFRLASLVHSKQCGLLRNMLDERCLSDLLRRTALVFDALLAEKPRDAKRGCIVKSGRLC